MVGGVGFLTHPALAGAAAEPAGVILEPATPTALAFRWPVRGDGNGNARVSVTWRKAGDTAWKAAADLFRTHPDFVSPDNRVAGGILFAGSIVGLEPGARYAVKLSLVDPDGGSAERSFALATREDAKLPEPEREVYVRPIRAGEPPGGDGTRSDPIRGLAAAARLARPGDRLLLLPGVYAERDVRFPSGAPGRPIAVRGTRAVILDGGGAGRLVDIRGASWLRFDNLLFRNAGILVDADRASEIVLRGSRFEVVKFGIKSHGAAYRESRHILVSDNTFRGWLAWPPPEPYPEIYAVSLTGSGHVIRFNRIERVRDGIYNGDDGRLSSSDIHNNDIRQCADDGIETDYSDTNVRVYENRIVDCFFGVSAQPAHAGPVYVYRNFIYNARSSPFKLHNHTSGVVLYHNTSVRRGIPFLIQPGGETVNDVVTRNNLFVGTSGPALRSTGIMTRCDFDNDGYAWRSGAFALWNGRSYPSTAAARQAGGPYARHGAVDMGPAKPFAAALWPPESLTQETNPDSLDPRLAADGRAVDRGVPLSGFNDGFDGKAPDLGCCEAGVPLPHYGPRASR